MNTSPLRTLTARARRTWSDLDYIQRRLYELQTGISATGTPRRVDGLMSTRPYRRDY